MTVDGAILGCNDGIQQITIGNQKITVKILTYGATLSSVRFSQTELVLGLAENDASDQSGWQRPNNPCMNCVIGRIAGRTSSPVIIDDKPHDLLACDGGGGGIKLETNLHGGMVWNKANWSIVDVSPADKPTSVTLNYVCNDEYLPGSVDTFVTYRIVDNCLLVEYKATPTETTPISLTNHAYWNLSGKPEAVTINHLMMLYGDKVSNDNGSGDGVPTGETISIIDTPRDMTKDFVHMKDVVERQKTENPKFIHGEEFHLMKSTIDAPNVDPHIADCKLAAILKHAENGICMKMYTTEPAIQTYYATLLDNEIGRGGHTYGNHFGVCLEATRLANAENFNNSSRIVRKGDAYKQTTIHEFISL